MITKKELMKFGDSEIIATGTGTYPKLNDKEIRWVAVSGNGYYDWCIYYHLPYNDVDAVARNGDKCFDESVIKRLVTCDDEAFALYRY